MLDNGSVVSSPRNPTAYNRLVSLHDVRELLIEASSDEVLDVMLDLETLPEWSPAHLASTILERDESGRPLRSKSRIQVAGFTDDVVIALQYHPDGYSSRLEAATHLREQNVRYSLTPDPNGTRVRFEITVEPTLPVPGFILRRVTQGLRHTATEGLRQRVLALQRRNSKFD